MPVIGTANGNCNGILTNKKISFKKLIDTGFCFKSKPTL